MSIATPLTPPPGEEREARMGGIWREKCGDGENWGIAGREMGKTLTLDFLRVWRRGVEEGEERVLELENPIEPKKN